MDNFGLLTRIVEVLRGSDYEVWHEILERALNTKDPYTVRIPQVATLDVVWSENIDPVDLIEHLQAKGCTIDEKIRTAFDLEKNRDTFRLRSVTKAYNGQALIRFDPASFGVPYDTRERAAFGFDATIGYQKVVDAALQYGFAQPDLATALFFRNRFWDAHRYSEGTRYYIACKPLAHEIDKPPIIPVLDYDRYYGWSVRSQEVGAESALNMSVAHGQGEHMESTFVFVLPLQH